MVALALSYRGVIPGGMLNDHTRRTARRARRRVPQCWLMTDPRLALGLASGLVGAIACLPPRSAVVVRRDMLCADQAQMLRAVRRVARARRHLLLTSGRTVAGFDGRHASGGVLHTGNRRRRPGWQSVPVHNAREAARARALRADAVLVSPVYPTRSHPGSGAIGPAGFARLARISGCPAIALGGMNPALFPIVRRFGASGWAAIDAWLVPAITAGRT